MDTTKLKKFAQYARRSLIEQVSNKLKLVLNEDSAARRESVEAVKKLEEQIKIHNKKHVIEQVAYIWFNRFCALRFMDVNRYTRISVVSPAEGQFQPEILAEAKMGHIDEGMIPDTTKQQIFTLLDGTAPSKDPQSEAYRLLVVAACNNYNKAMPYMFERIADYTELLMPDDLLSGNSVLAYTREAMTPDICEDVEVIGWLYQFYISEKKDEVFDGLKKNKKITPENIPAATQLFTPHWIVRYLVENSLGRLWMLNHPNSELTKKMDYYIKPEQPETDFLRISSPEEIKICDPACGSGHMLTYAFDLLYAIYEEEGYESAEIPEKILTQNLYGIEIDERAGELAAFALSMKARGKQRRFFRKGITPNICVLKNIHVDEAELKEYMDFIGQDLFTVRLQNTLRQFEESDNFGSLIRPDVTDVGEILSALDSKDVSGQLFLNATHQKVLQALQQIDYLSPKYHVVIANPPYMGGKGMNGRMGKWMKDNYADVKSDLFSAFIVRNTELALPKGQLGFMSPFVWMFISSYEKLRSFLINKKTVTSLVQLEYSGFDGATVPICTFTVENAHHSEFKGSYIRLSDFRGSENQAPKTLEAIKNPDCGWLYRVSATDFKKIPGSPIAYWAPHSAIEAFENGIFLGDLVHARIALATGDNGAFVRSWSEVSINNIGFNINSNSKSVESGRKWFPCNKGGDFRKWYGNNDNVVNWLNDGEDVKSLTDPSTGRVRSHNYNGDFGFQESVTWSALSSSKLGVRYSKSGFMFVTPGSSAFKKNNKTNLYTVQSLLSSKIADYFLRLISATMNIEVGNILRIPFISSCSDVIRVAQCAIKLAQFDEDTYETSRNFTKLHLVQSIYHQPIIKTTYDNLYAHWQKMVLEMQQLEQENNRIFIDAYGLQDELTPEVPLKEITLTCNPHYRYGGKKSEEELETLLLADTMKEFISYAVGCMFGRYALDQPGLILANQGETIDDYLKQIPESSFPADDDNVIPMLDGDWFTDDITERFFKFLRVTFGEEHYENNLNFIEQSIGKDIRKYFLKDFYSDHVKRYKKRPIYWLFSSAKGSFNALIYMHRYRPDTVSIVLNDYLREFNTKLSSRKQHLEAISISASASQSEKTKALKEIEKLNKMIVEMEDYEREVLYPLATEQVEIDLDDGVKVNYNKFGAALKKITGLSGK